MPPIIKLEMPSIKIPEKNIEVGTVPQCEAPEFKESLIAHWPRRYDVIKPNTKARKVVTSNGSVIRPLTLKTESIIWNTGAINNVIRIIKVVLN